MKKQTKKTIWKQRLKNIKRNKTEAYYVTEIKKQKQKCSNQDFWA